MRRLGASLALSSLALMLAVSASAGETAVQVDYTGHWQSGPLSSEADPPRFELDVDRVNGEYRASLTTKLLWAVQDEPLDVIVSEGRISFFAPGLSGRSPVIEVALVAGESRLEGFWRFRYGTEPSREVTFSRSGVSRAPPYLTSPTMPVPKLLEVDGARLHFTVVDGRRVVVALFPGAGRNSTSWLPVQAEIARTTGARVVAYDPAGSGKSDFDDTPYDAEREVSQVRAGLAALGSSEKVIVVGHSYGGLLAQIYAAKYPDEVAGVVLVDPVVAEYMTEERMPHIGRVDLSPASSDGPFHAAKTRVYRETVAKALARPLPAGMPVSLLSCADLEWWEQDENRKAWRASHENFVAGNPNRRLVLARASGHFINQDRPDLIVQEVAGMVASADALPLRASRIVRFPTNEGTWLSLDVSPDGRTILFDLLGDLYTLPISGGTATRITQGMAFDSQPRYSPDGTRILFVSDRDGTENVWLMDADGSRPRLVTREKRDMFISPEWTPDGESLVVTRAQGASGLWGWGGGPMDLYLYAIGGGTGVRLTNGPPPTAVGSSVPGAVRYTGAAFGRSGNSLFAAASLGSSWQVVSLHLDSPEPVVLTDAPGSAMRPAVSPDGRYFAYATRRSDVTSLRLRDLRDGSDRALLHGVTRDGQRDPDLSRDLVPGYSFTPDGLALIVSREGRLSRVAIQSGVSTPIPFVAEVEQALGPLAHSPYALQDDRVRVRQLKEARPSPDGSRLVFVALDRLWLMELPNGTPRRLTSGSVGEYSPAWSPDGKFIAYATWSDDGGGYVYRASVAGRGQPRRLTTRSAFYERLAYMPDGGGLLASRVPRAARAEARSELRQDQSRRMWGAELIRIPSTGGESEIVTALTSAKAHTPTFYGTPHFSRDRSRIYLHDYQEGLVSMDLRGGDRRVLLKVTAWDSERRSRLPAEDVVISPDGTQALALANQRLYLIDLPSLAAPKIPVVSVDDPTGSPLPMRKVTRVGGDFPGWSGRPDMFHYSLGSTYFDQDAKTGRSRSIDVALEVPRDRPSGTVVLRGARVITMKGNQIIDDGDVIISNNRIEAVVARGSHTIRDDAHIVDVTGSTIVPGLFDVHAHAWPAWGAHRTRQIWLMG
jgi:Tol biopolymer transport system component/pimeloyl-ACP methyl ester carboxylesterase